MMRLNIVIFGGLGYIGSVVAADLIKLGHNVLILDNGSNCDFEGKLKIFDKYKFNNIDKCDLTNILQTKYRIDNSIGRPDVIMHFAAFKSVPESMNEPYRYYSNNINITLTALELCRIYNCRLVHSSSASVYGFESDFHVNKQLPLPSSVYSHTKALDESLIEMYNRSAGINAVSLRYFNPIGTSDDLLLGPNINSDEKNVVGVLCEKLSNGDKFQIFGNDYPTRDGTCIRDYIDIRDVSKAHIQAIERVMRLTGYNIYNIGSGIGTTVSELVNQFNEAISTETNLKLEYEYQGKRKGDVAVSVASLDINSILPGFEITHSVTEGLRNEFKYYKLNEDK